MPYTIDLFMWPYQGHLQASLEDFAKRTLREAGLNSDVRAILVGIRDPDTNSHPVCIEPERGPISLDLFAQIDDTIAALASADPRNSLVYGDEPSNRDKPASIRASAVSGAVRDCLAPSDRARRVQSFIGAAGRVRGYLVVPILQVPLRDLASVPRLGHTTRKGYVVPTSLADEVLAEVLREATRELGTAEPGRKVETFKRDPIDILRSAGDSMMARPEFVANRTAIGLLFDGCNQVSALRYEGSAGRGRMVVARRGHPAVHILIEFERPVPLRSSTWARKVLQMGSEDVALLCEGTQIYGLGQLCDSYDVEAEDAFVVDFVGHYTWDLRHADAILMRTAYAVPRLPSIRISEAEVRDRLKRVFSQAKNLDASRIWSLVRGAIEQKHGTLLVVSEQAVEEAARLAAQATPVKPVDLSDAVIRRVTGIDGAVLLDVTGRCHAIGVILDGVAVRDGDPARGARFNSAKRYVANAKASTVAFVVSEDGKVNVLPELRPLVRSSEVNRHVATLHSFADDPLSDWHRERSWLDEHRFYLNAEQCAQVNDDLKKLAAKVTTEIGAVWWAVAPFEVDPDMNDSYFEPEP